MEKSSKKVLIQLRNLTKRFGSFTAVSNLNFEIYKGEIFGFLGPNGAGKSTTMKMIADLLNPTEGEVWIRDKNKQLKKLTSKTEDVLLDNCGFLIENPAFYEDLTPRQILTYFAKLKGYTRNKIPERVEEVVAMVGMSEWIDKKFKTFSKGMTQKIGIASSLVHDPEILILDEPSTGLDPSARKELRDLLINLKVEQGKTMFISSHLLFEISEMADRVGIISHGRIIELDTIENLEAKAQKSTIRMELFEIEENHSITDTMKNIKEILSKCCPIFSKNSQNNQNFLRYNPNLRKFEIDFDGSPINQYEILKILIENGYKVIDFSVPRGNLLEDLYLELIKKSEQMNITEMKSQIKVKGVL